MDVLRIFSFIWLLITSIYASKIIALLPVASTSHKNVFTPVVNELASRGHQVTIVSPIKPKNELPANVKEVVLPQAMETFMANMQKSIFEDSMSFSQMEFGIIRNMIVESCENLFNDSTIKTFLKENKPFDVALVSQFFNDCGLSLAYLLAKHVIHFSSGGQFPWLPTQILSPPSYVPNHVFPYTDHMSFWERTKNFLSIVTFQALYPIFIQPISQDLLKKYVPAAPSLEEAFANISFTILNTDPVYFSPRPSMPNVVHIGGAHGARAQPLPKEFAEFADSSREDGFIMFSLGSIAQSQYLPSPIKDAFLSAFKRLKQKVIWKYEDDLQGLPDNVKVTKWLPQQDLLGHPKIRLFITHGGLLSLEEALYHAVPIIGIPLFGDQAGNVARVRELGIGEMLDRKNITAEGLFQTITKLLNDQSYKEKMKKYSLILHHQPQSSLDRAVFWIEYVIRHNGAHHFRSAGQELNFFQFFLLDVVAVILIAFSTVTVLAVLLIKLGLRKIRGCPKKHATHQKKDD